MTRCVPQPRLCSSGGGTRTHNLRINSPIQGEPAICEDTPGRALTCSFAYSWNRAVSRLFAVRCGTNAGPPLASATCRRTCPMMDLEADYDLRTKLEIELLKDLGPSGVRLEEPADLLGASASRGGNARAGRGVQVPSPTPPVSSAGLLTSAASSA
jgi:hypothetical protein